jgi:hypothetical protein
LYKTALSFGRSIFAKYLTHAMVYEILISVSNALMLLRRPDCAAADTRRMVHPAAERGPASGG